MLSQHTFVWCERRLIQLQQTLGVNTWIDALSVQGGTVREKVRSTQDRQLASTFRFSFQTVGTNILIVCEALGMNVEMDGIKHARCDIKHMYVCMCIYMYVYAHTCMYMHYRRAVIRHGYERGSLGTA